MASSLVMPALTGPMLPGLTMSSLESAGGAVDSGVASGVADVCSTVESMSSVFGSLPHPEVIRMSTATVPNMRFIGPPTGQV